MLYITVVHSHESEDEVWGIDAYFDNTYEPWWIDNEFARRVIREVDKSEVIAPRIIDSPYLGYVDPTHLSGGTKCILCLAFDRSQWKFNITVCGDNCMRWIQMLSKNRDLHVYMSNLPKFSDDEHFDILIENKNIHCKNYWDVLGAWAEVHRQ